MAETLARFGGAGGLPITGTWPLTASPTPFSVNFWFDVDSDGQLFNWEGASGCPGSAPGASCDRMTGPGGDSYALGPSAPMNLTNSHRAIQLDAATPFYMQGLCGGQTKTFQAFEHYVALEQPTSGGGGGVPATTSPATTSFAATVTSTSPLAVSIYVLAAGVGMFGFGRFLVKGGRWSRRIQILGAVLIVAGFAGILLFA